LLHLRGGGAATSSADRLNSRTPGVADGGGTDVAVLR